VAPWKWSPRLFELRSIENAVECERFVRLVWDGGVIEIATNWNGAGQPGGITEAVSRNDRHKKSLTEVKLLIFYKGGFYRWLFS